MSARVVVGTVVLHSAWKDSEVGAVPPPLPDTNIGALPSSDLPVPKKTVLVRVDAPRGGCWSATIENELLKNNCGSLAFPLEVEGFVIVHFERQVPGSWHFSVAIDADGRVVQTVGPTTTEYPSLDIGYRVPENE